MKQNKFSNFKLPTFAMPQKPFARLFSFDMEKSPKVPRDSQAAVGHALGTDQGARDRLGQVQILRMLVLELIQMADPMAVAKWLNG